MSRLDRYILKELMVPLMIGTIAVLLMFQANLLIAVLKQYPGTSTPLAAVIQVIWYRTPLFLSMTLPIGVSLGASLAMSRLARESELVALRSAGTSLRRIMLPVVFTGALVGAGNFYLVEKIIPPSEKAANRLMVEMAVLGAAPEFRSNVIINLRNYTASFGSVMRGTNNDAVEFQDALLFERQRVGEVHVYQAKRGYYRGGNLVLQDALLRIFKNDELTEVRSAKDVTIREPITISELFVSPSPPERTAEELRETITELKRQQRDTVNLEINYHIKYSVPASCIAFALVGPVFAIRSGRSGGFVGVLMSFLVVLGYYNAFIISTEILGKKGMVSPFWAAWLPNLLFLVVGVWVLRKLE